MTVCSDINKRKHNFTKFKYSGSTKIPTDHSN